MRQTTKEHPATPVMCSQMWDFSQGIMLTMLAIRVCDYRSFANSWAFRRPALGWAGRAHQKAEVWFNTWNMSEQSPVSLVFTAKAAKHAQGAGMTASLSRARFRSPWEVRSKWDALRASQDAHRGWSASKSYTLIWVNSELSHIACKLMGIRVRGHFKELW